MTASIAWLKAFPLAEAERAVDALLRGWNEMAARNLPRFRPSTKEPHLTRVVRAYIRQRVAPEMKLLGYWGTEGVENDVDFDSGDILREGRTDIAYAWNNENVALLLVFEFKKLGCTTTSRKNYIHKGVQNFVSGIYSDKQAVALMVGILVAPREATVRGLRQALSHRPTATAVRACADENQRYVLDPSVLFPAHADFDTEHLRSPEKAPPHGTIRIAHVFVEFSGAPTSQTVPGGQS